MSISEDEFTVPKVEEEIKLKAMDQLRFNTAVEGGKLKVQMPSEEYLAKVKTAATIVGDSFFLSETDTQVLALALELKATGHNPRIITDDYSIQNVATKIGIEYTSLTTFGISRLLKWIRYCPACRRQYPANYSSRECPVCGTPLKRKPQRTAKKIHTKNPR